MTVTLYVASFNWELEKEKTLQKAQHGMQAILSCRLFISADPMVLEVSLTDFLELFLLHICFRFWTRH